MESFSICKVHCSWLIWKVELKYENKQIFTAAFNFRGILPTFQYTTIKMIIFSTCKNLLNNEKFLKNAVRNFWWKETLLKVHHKNKMVSQLWLLWWIWKLWSKWWSRFQRNILKKIDFESESPSVTGKVCCHYNRWVNGVCMAYMFDKNSGRKTSQIEQLFEANLRFFGYLNYSAALWPSLDPNCKCNLLTRVGWVF